LGLIFVGTNTVRPYGSPINGRQII